MGFCVLIEIQLKCVFDIVKICMFYFQKISEMKATGPTETSTPKAPFNKSIKRSRSKVTKSNRQSSTQQQQSSDLVYNPASAECFREKVCFF